MPTRRSSRRYSIGTMRRRAESRTPFQRASTRTHPMRWSTSSLFLCILGILSPIVQSCSKRTASRETSLAGTYMYTYPSGQVEVLFMRNNLTFHQEIFDSRSDLTNSKPPRFSNNGTWSYADHEKHELEFDDWLEVCEPWDSREMLETPRQVLLLNVYWEPPSRGIEARISTNGENGPRFLRTRP
jgi:hypothetical protein